MQPGQRLSASVVNFEFIVQNLHKFTENQQFSKIACGTVPFVQRSNKSRQNGGFIILS
jgi:uncharacterized membrane protein